MQQRPDPRQVIRMALDQVGGARKALASFVMLCVLLVAVFMPIPAVYELWMVGQVEQWQEVPVRLDAVARKRPTFGKGQATWRYAITDPQLGKTYETGDVRPGDIPFAALGWSTSDATARDYQAKVGQLIRVRRSPDGQRYFLRAGERTTMTVVLGLCALYWGWLLAARRRRGGQR